MEKNFTEEQLQAETGKTLDDFIRENVLARQFKTVDIGLGISDRVDEWERELANHA